MTAPTTERPSSATDVRDDVLEDVAPDVLDAQGQGTPPPPGDHDEERIPPPPVAWRPLIAGGLATVAAGMVAGGIFGVWSARLLGLFAAVFGVFWAWLTLRYPARTTLLTGLLPPAALTVGTLLLIPAGGGGPSELPSLIREAVESGRLLRPPVPFDPGWRPIMMLVFAMLGFAAVWVGTALERPRMAIAVPLPLLALTAITQPAEGEFIAGLCAFVPLIAALAVLFSGDTIRASELTRAFELKRAVRSLAAMIAAVVALVFLSNASFLFPEPVYDPSDQPQKPKAIPLSASRDRVLFEVAADNGITGPWKTGSLDVYDGKTWRLPPFDTTRFEEVPENGVVNEVLSPKATGNVSFTVRELGDSATLPGTATPARIDKPDDADIKFDRRADVFRVPQGRVPEGLTYTISLPPYPDAAALKAAPEPKGDFTETLEIPKAPASVQSLLEAAPKTPAWDRLEFVRQRLQSVAVAVGGGTPKDVPPATVTKILDGDHEGSPFELVAVEAMLARWAGIPSRIGFGFDGLNDEEGTLTVRPKNAAQWLEVYFEGHGWVPLIGAPPKAKAELNTDPNQRFNPTVIPSGEVAVELYVPIRVESLRQLYQRIREQLLALLPYAVLIAVVYMSWPATQKAWRRRKRRRWADALGPRAQIAVEYAEFRDLAHDLNVGDPYDTSLEYLKKVQDDDQHSELAWLVARAMYGDLSRTVTDEDARAAEELSTSLRRRMFRGQPFQSRVLAILSKASLRQPYSTEVPNVRQFDPWTRLSTRLAAIRRRRRPARTRRMRRTRIPALPTLGRR